MARLLRVSWLRFIDSESLINVALYRSLKGNEIVSSPESEKSESEKRYERRANDDSTKRKSESEKRYDVPTN